MPSAGWFSSGAPSKLCLSNRAPLRCCRDKGQGVRGKGLGTRGKGLATEEQSAAERTVRSFRDLKVWQKAMRLAVSVYAATKGFPASERYGLATQIRRAAGSIPANVAEGHIRHSRKEFLRYLDIALGSAAELETHLLLAQETGKSPSREQRNSSVASPRYRRCCAG